MFWVLAARAVRNEGVSATKGNAVKDFETVKTGVFEKGEILEKGQILAQSN